MDLEELDDTTVSDASGAVAAAAETQGYSGGRLWSRAKALWNRYGTAGAVGGAESPSPARTGRAQDGVGEGGGGDGGGGGEASEQPESSELVLAAADALTLVLARRSDKVDKADEADEADRVEAMVTASKGDEPTAVAGPLVALEMIPMQASTTAQLGPAPEAGSGSEEPPPVDSAGLVVQPAPQPGTAAEAPMLSEVAASETVEAARNVLNVPSRRCHSSPPWPLATQWEG